METIDARVLRLFAPPARGATFIVAGRAVADEIRVARQAAGGEEARAAACAPDRRRRRAYMRSRRRRRSAY